MMRRKYTKQWTGLLRLAHGGLGDWGWRANLAKAYGNAHGFRANKGSWIVQVFDGGRGEYTSPTHCQGWLAFYVKYYGRIWKSVLVAEREGLTVRERWAAGPLPPEMVR